MKAIILSLIAATAAVSSLQAHCGTCSMDEGAGHGDAHASCQEGTLASYFAIQKALAGDDLAAAKKSAGELATAVSQSECSVDGGDCCAEVAGACESIAGAADISVARQAFLAFSNAMIAQLESHPGETTAYKMYCPMAFNNKGGAWLQDSADLRNPYYGAMMLTCGMKQATFGKDTGSSHHAHEDHSGHNH